MLLDHISLKACHRVSFARFCCLFIAIAFLFGQSLSSAHAHTHDHSDTSPLNEVCEVCILAINNDSDVEIAAAPLSGDDKVSFFWTQIDVLTRAEPQSAPQMMFESRPIDPPPEPDVRSDAARAPPLYI